MTIWEYCEVQRCKDVGYYPLDSPPSSTPSITFPNASRSNHGSGSGLFSVVVAVGGIVSFGFFVLLFVAAFIGCCLFLYRKKKRIHLATISTMYNCKYVTNDQYSEATFSNKKQSLVIPENFTLLDSKDIKYVSQLGQGNFGIVFKGKAFGIKQSGEGEEDEGIEVAVKTLKVEATSEVKQDFIDEAKLMFTFDHPNILKIHGVCMSEMPYQLVFEYMDEGDLTKFLRSRASSQRRRLMYPFNDRSRTESSYSDDPASLTKTDLLYICKQIAAGMKYLAENKHVHRDLACRNCLIKSDLVVKIGDFGMSRNLYSKDYYRINGSAVLPVRWMSPESLIYGKFSVEGDVWSFGVVMWEVFSFALQPYYGITNEEVTEAVRRGKTLSRPDDCPVYDLMKQCWAMDPADRITFYELHESLCRSHRLHSMSVCTPLLGNDDGSSDGSCDGLSNGSSNGSSNAFYSNENLDT